MECQDKNCAKKIKAGKVNKPWQKAIESADPSHLSKRALKRKETQERKQQAIKDRIASALAKKRAKRDEGAGPSNGAGSSNG